MAIRADRPQVPNRIHPVLFSNFGQGNQVVNMNEVPSNFSVDPLEIEFTYNTLAAIVCNPLLPSARASLVRVNNYSLQGSLM